MDTMYFESLPNAVDIAQDLQMPQFSLVDYKVIDCSMNYTSGFHQSISIFIKITHFATFSILVSSAVITVFN